MMGMDVAVLCAARRSPPCGELILALAIAAALAPFTAAVAVGSTQLPGAATLRAELHALLPQAPKAAQAPAAILPVSSCADDNSPDTLRSVIAAAGEGDTIDLAGLHCSAITLSQGAVPVLLDELTLIGPGAAALKIDGAGADRVFVHPGGGALTLRGLTVRNGAARVAGAHVTGGGCIASAGYVVLDHSTVSDCYASAEGVYGGAIFAYALRMYTSVLTRNVGFAALPDTGTATFGGGAYANTLTLVDSTVSANRAAHDLAESGYDTGGGVFTNTGGTISGSTIEGNYSHGIGGGVSAFAGELDVVNSTISGNIARTRSGGGLDLRAVAEVSIANSTIASNEAALGGGVYLRGTPRAFSVQSTLIAGNSAPGGGADFGSISPVSLSGANNLIVAAGAAVSVPAGTLHDDPRLQALADNGGPTRTRALSAGSPALDTGNNLAALASDQRGPGFPRVLGAAADIGAFEGYLVPVRQPANVPALSVSGRLVMAALLALAGFMGLGRRQGG